MVVSSGKLKTRHLIPLRSTIEENGAVSLRDAGGTSDADGFSLCGVAAMLSICGAGCALDLKGGSLVAI